MTVEYHALKMEALKAQAAANPDCETCKRHLDAGAILAPKHKASDRCRSGKRSHCSCDTCF